MTLPSSSRRRGSRNAIAGVIGEWWRAYAARMEGRWCRGIGFGSAVIGGLVSGGRGAGRVIWAVRSSDGM